MICCRMEESIKPCAWILFCLLPLISLTASGLEVNLTILESAVAKGAVCLDGSPPAYHFAPGFGSGVDSWLVHIEGGGWCHNVTNCLHRKMWRLGSSKAMGSVRFSGILNDHRQFNPYFYNWNKVKVGYCDGSSFTGDIERVDPATKLHYRGARIFAAVMEDLLARGMKNARNALLSGCSAGGLTTVLHCDRFRAFLPAGARVKCLTDGGFFINVNDIAGVDYIKSYFNNIVETHGSAKNLPPSCTSRMSPNMCFFPQYVVPQVRTPLFILNSAYDSWQIRNVLVPPESDPTGAWKQCRADISQCNVNQIEALQGFRRNFLGALGRLETDPSRGYFINSCFAHCQTELTATWKFAHSPVLGNTTVAEAVGVWFYDLRDFKMIDCPYPCDSSCYNNKYNP
uniref:Pectin acetylesterase n=2 Tax=Anthurium amnicola TaxID=1678845 RepID=A0A1D1YAA9_9ARAE